MEQLRVIGTDNDRFILATDTGERFVLPVDQVRSEMRRTRREQEGESRTPRPSPREVQAHIRAGLSTEEVATLLGARVEDVARYERPVLAEREHMVGQALAVPVLLAGDFDADVPPTFGTAVRAKLAEAGAAGERWTSWKEPTGWVVKLEFTAAGVDHDARWSFDPRRSSLAPLNSDATQLSRQGGLPEGLIPRLRALDTPLKDDTRFDSGAFGPRRLQMTQDAGADVAGAAAPVAAASSHPLSAPSAHPAAQDAAIKRAPQESTTSSETADLLEALRRRRGQREPLPGTESEPARTASPVALFDALEPGYEAVGEPEPEPVPADAADGARRKGRPSMPSWDEIVFGARTEEN